MELTPKTRKEVFLAAAGGQDVTTPTPVTREEVFLDAIAKGGGGGGGSSGGGVLVVHDVNGTLDKTWQEIFDADFAVIKTSSNENQRQMHYIITVDVYDGSYELDTISGMIYAAATASDYPSHKD